MKITTLAFAISSTLILSACGGGSDSGNTDTQPTTISGKAIDGYIVGATVYLDLNYNGKLDAGEPNAVTTAGGGFDIALNANDASCSNYVPTVVDVPIGAVDEDLGVVEHAYQLVIPPLVLIKSDADIRNITPLTSVLWTNIEKDLKAENIGILTCEKVIQQTDLREKIASQLKEQEYRLANRFNVPVDELYGDFIASGNTILHDNAMNLVEAMQLSYEATTTLLARPEILSGGVEYFQGHWNVAAENEANKNNWYRRTTATYRDGRTINHVEQMDETLNNIIGIEISSITRDESANGLNIKLSYEIENNFCHLFSTLSQTSDTGYSLTNTHRKEGITTIQACGDINPEETFAYQNIESHRHLGDGHTSGSTTELGKFYYEDDIDVQYKDLNAAFNMLDASALDAYNYISVEFTDNALHNSVSATRQLSTRYADRYEFIVRDLHSTKWTKSINYYSGLYENFCSTDGQIWTIVEQLYMCDDK